jgi:hypothetical protein
MTSHHSPRLGAASPSTFRRATNKETDMKTLLVTLSLVTAAPALAGGAYPEEAKWMAEDLSDWRNAGRVCGPEIARKAAAAMADARAYANRVGLDWARIERNAKSSNRSVSRHECDKWRSTRVGTYDFDKN